MVSEQSSTKEESRKYTIYFSRWYVLLTVCLLALSNGTIWVTYANLTPATNAFYCGLIIEGGADRCGVTHWTSQIFQIVGVVCGIFGMYITDKYGIRVSCYFAATTNLVGAAIRVISSIPAIDLRFRLPVLYLGQTWAALAQPFFLCLSPKVAEYWFPDDQRGLANSLSFVANPLGVIVGSLIPTWIVSSNIKITDSMELLHVNLLASALALIVMLMTFGLMRGKPPTPPSASSEADFAPSFFAGLKQLIKIPQFYVHIFSFGASFAIPWSFIITIIPVLDEIGYTRISGYLISISAAVGIFSSVIGGVIVDRTKWFKELIKACYIGIALCAISLNLLLRHKNEGGSILIDCSFAFFFAMLGFFATPIYPIGLELGVEITFPVAEATSSGILIIGGQLQLFLVTFLMQVLIQTNWFRKTQLQYPDQKDLPSSNFLLSADFWCIFTIFTAVFTCIALLPKYNRVRYEEEAIAAKRPETLEKSRKDVFAISK